MTPLLNGHAVKVGLASTSITRASGIRRLSSRAQVAPAKPPPTTTTRGWPCASAGIGTSAASEPLRKWRRVAARDSITSLSLCAEPLGDRADFRLGEALGDAVHHGRGLLPGPERLHRGDDLGRIAAGDARHARLDLRARRMAAGA